ncbi:hypothetical protein DVH24_021838 [Malus domestica]|uniref:Band 7 domain-containing protein n=1 Tax=Malus domestica TaxID=3750 RepID=A0A498IW96_MALDO|nr:hypothetical protein DVH24_021838 [Malus domestica]
MALISGFYYDNFPTSSTISIPHQVPEGHVGVSWRRCALLKAITDPGFHLKLPLVTHFEPIQVTLQTDHVRDIPYGTKGCVMINFEKIEKLGCKASWKRTKVRSRPIELQEKVISISCKIRLLSAHKNTRLKLHNHSYSFQSRSNERIKF